MLLRRFGLSFIIACSMAALVAAAPSTTPVADAAMRGDRDAVRTLLKDGADVNGAQGDGMTALHWAAQRGDAELTTMLVYAGADLSAITRIGAYTPLHLAARSGNAAVVESLLEGGADATARTSTSAVTPLHLAAAAGNVAVIDALLAKGADVNAKEEQWGQTPLIFAASANRAAAITTLLKHGADPKVTTKTLDLVKFQELERAAAKERRKVLEQLAGKGADGALAAPSEVQAAIRAGREIMTTGVIPPKDPNEPEDPRERFFRDQGPPSITAMGGLTALHHAARQGYMEAAKALLDGGADVNEPTASDHSTPLLVAIINGQFDLALEFIKRGADPNIEADVNAVTPLWAAVNTQWQPRTRYPQPQELEFQEHSYLDVMKALLDAGADPDHRIKMHPWYMVYSDCGNANCGLADTAGSTAFWRAAYATDVEAMRLLAKYGADPNVPTIAPKPRRRRPDAGGGPNSDGSEKKKATETATKAADRNVGQQADSAKASSGAPAAADKPAGTPAAGDDKKADAGKPKPQSAGPDPTAPIDPDEDQSGLPPVPYGGPGVYPLHAAAGVGYGEGFAGNAHRHAPDAWLASVKFLVEEMGADVNARDQNGYTALHHAAARGDKDTILYLLDKGADITVVSRRGQTVADMANGPVQRVSPFPEIVALLEKLGSKNNHNCVTC
ncbi:MAG: ankyrin repeat domain-containing protein [Vicinamibacterales bacterium]